VLLSIGRLAEPASARPTEEQGWPGLVAEPPVRRLATVERHPTARAVRAAVEDQLLPAVDVVERRTHGSPKRLAPRPAPDFRAVPDDVLDHVERAFEDVADERRNRPAPPAGLRLERLLEILGDARVEPALVAGPEAHTRSCITL